jgi:hypothetical protein
MGKNGLAVIHIEAEPNHDRENTEVKKARKLALTGA